MKSNTSVNGLVQPVIFWPGVPQFMQEALLAVNGFLLQLPEQIDGEPARDGVVITVQFNLR